MVHLVIQTTLVLVDGFLNCVGYFKGFCQRKSRQRTGQYNLSPGISPPEQLKDLKKQQQKYTVFWLNGSDPVIYKLLQIPMSKKRPKLINNLYGSFRKFFQKINSTNYCQFSKLIFPKLLPTFIIMEFVFIGIFAKTHLF